MTDEKRTSNPTPNAFELRHPRCTLHWLFGEAKHVYKHAPDCEHPDEHHAGMVSSDAPVRAADGRWICGTCKGSGKAVENYNGESIAAWCKPCGGDGTVHDETKALRETCSNEAPLVPPIGSKVLIEATVVAHNSFRRDDGPVIPTPCVEVRKGISFGIACEDVVRFEPRVDKVQAEGACPTCGHRNLTEDEVKSEIERLDLKAKRVAASVAPPTDYPRSDLEPTAKLQAVASHVQAAKSGIIDPGVALHRIASVLDSDPCAANPEGKP